MVKKISVVIGASYGDEGKGLVTDAITNIDESVANKIVNSLTEISNKEWEGILSSANEIDSEQQENTNLGVKFIISTDYISENFVSFRSELSGGFGGVGWSNTDL